MWGRKTRSVEELFQKSLHLIVNAMVIFIIFVLLVGLGKTVYSVKNLFLITDFSDSFSHVITDILSFLVILELFRNFIEFFRLQRFRLHNMMDPFIIFVVRELMVILYTREQILWPDILAFAALIISLGVVRTLAVIHTPQS